MELPNIVQEWLRVSLMMRAAQKLEPKIKSETVFWQPWLDKDDSSKQSCQKQTTKWKRDRRSRLPEYSRKSDPKFSETFGLEPPSNADVPSNGISSNGVGSKTSNDTSNGVATDTPLDMSVRQRGLPPSYSQTINNPGYRSNYRPSVIQNGVPNREELPSGISMCDPIIDEHFRRSLGNDYHTLFQNNNLTKEQCAPKSPPKTPTNVIELMDSTGLSVDDHFAKALGDTWAKLNKKDPEVKTNTSENNLVST
ncbi:uncharacterized protein LOC108913224 isoform X1 [Anoplophora glabripennis]|uniref:uncharacterized protein LOC108913224 isoform X1 n=1 Tax=Anoplophora glabripennis TaxID=217634 RepID=UPI0008755040|nr:uncharacterized protein LOC108913224 isoform X1 [Anoplophora glabripennis]